MNRLDLVKFAAQKLGTKDRDEISSTTTVTSKYVRDIIEAVDTAWLAIQTLHEGVWHWRRKQASFDTVAHQRLYNFTDIDADCVGILPMQHRAPGDPYILTGNNEIHYVDYQYWRGYYDRADRGGEQRPQLFTVRNDGGTRIEFDPTPDQAYTIELDILHDVQTLTADSDIPLMPPRFHKTIAIQAARDLAEYDESPRFQTLNRELAVWRNNLEQDQLPKDIWLVRPIG